MKSKAFRRNGKNDCHKVKDYDDCKNYLRILEKCLNARIVACGQCFDCIHNVLISRRIENLPNLKD